MTRSCLWPARAAWVGLIFCLILSACVGQSMPGGRPDERPREVLLSAQQAALVLYDAMAPSFGEEGAGIAYPHSLGLLLGGEVDCQVRYAAEALRTRCALFVAAITTMSEGQVPNSQSMRLDTRSPQPETARMSAPAEAIAALRKDAPNLFALGRAAEVRSLQAIDFEWLSALDRIFDGLNGRAQPNAAVAASQFRDLVQRVERMLARSEPDFRAASPYEVMDDAGRALSSDELADLILHVAAAETALVRFDEAASRWRGIAATLADYDALLAATELGLHAGPALDDGPNPVRRYAALLIDQVSRIGGSR